LFAAHRAGQRHRKPRFTGLYPAYLLVGRRMQMTAGWQFS
jgi:hypothetical protein